MKCYLCEKTPGPSGTHYHVRDAVGICQNCGIGICLEHSQKDAKAGSPLLCPPCAKFLHAEGDKRSLQVQVETFGTAIHNK